MNESFCATKSTQLPFVPSYQISNLVERRFFCECLYVLEVRDKTHPVLPDDLGKGR